MRCLDLEYVLVEEQLVLLLVLPVHGRAEGGEVDQAVCGDLVRKVRHLTRTIKIILYLAQFTSCSSGLSPNIFLDHNLTSLNRLEWSR